MATSCPKNPSLNRRSTYSRWMYRHGGTITSSTFGPPLTTSNGVNDNAPGSSWFNTGTNVIGPVSIPLHVRTRLTRSPTRTAVRSAFHQQRIGSEETSPGLGARGGGVTGAGVAVAGARDVAGPDVCAAGVCGTAVCADTDTPDATCPPSRATARIPIRL